MRILGVLATVASWLLIAASAPAQDVVLTPAPDWVTPPPPVEAAMQDDPSPVRLVLAEQQVRFDDQGTHNYTLNRSRVQNSQGLAFVSTVNVVWSPPRETVEVHSVRILRGDQVIDVLENQSFEILRRENNLEASMLDGALTATLQPRDLRVGDVLETSVTIHDTGGVLAPHREMLAFAGSGLVIDRYRLRVSWPDGQPVRAEASTPWQDMRPRRVGGDWIFEIDEKGLLPQHMPGDLPVRFQLIRMAQFTDFADWGAPSRLMAPLYERAATLEAGSPLEAEIERIKNTYAGDAERAAAALRLVQDEVRYVALTMGQGGYVPTPADDVWRSRYGDCKGKTVLLLALLDGLGIEAEAALVSTSLGDGLPDRLPMIAWFDHVIVRATVDGEVHWMDGARVGDRTLAGLTPPPYRWALPVRREGAELEPIVQAEAETPSLVTTIALDASAGLDAEAPLTLDMAYHGDSATSIRGQISAVPADQLQTWMLSTLNTDDAATTIDAVETRYDEQANVFHMILRGKSRLPWINSAGGRLMAMPETAIGELAGEEREGLFAAFADHPYAINHPLLIRTETRLILPAGGEGYRLEGGDQTIESGGYRVERRGGIEDGVAEVVMTTRSLVSEVTAAEMAEARDRADSQTFTAMRLRAPADYRATAGDQARLEPGSSDMDDLVARAERLSGVGDTTGAVALLDAAIEREPDNADAIKARAAAKLAADDYAGARADYDRAVDLDPADADAAVGQGRTAMAEGRYNDAIVSFSVALRLDPENAGALSRRGSAYHQIGRWDRSLADYRALKIVMPQSSPGLFGELRALDRLKRFDEARSLIDARLEDEPTDVVALQALARLVETGGEPAQVLPRIEAAIEAASGARDLLTLRAETRVATGDEAGARADYETLRGQAASDPTLANNLCWSQAVAGFDLERALVDCDVAVAAGEAGYIDRRAMVLLQLERFEEAKAAYDQALAEAPNQASSLYGRGLARLAMGDEAGREDVERARALSVDVAEDFEVFEARRPDLAPSGRAGVASEPGA